MLHSSSCGLESSASYISCETTLPRHFVLQRIRNDCSAGEVRRIHGRKRLPAMIVSLLLRSAELTLQNLARGRHRQRLTELDVAWVLIIGHVRF